MINNLDLYMFIRDNYKYGRAKDKVYNYLTDEDIKSMKHGYYSTITETDSMSLYDLAEERSHIKDIAPFEEMEYEVDEDDSLEHETNAFGWGVYEITTDRAIFYLAEIYDENEKYSRCDFYFRRVSVDNYLNDVYRKDQKYFPVDLLKFL